VETTKFRESTRLFFGKLLQIVKTVLHPPDLCRWLVRGIKKCRESRSKVAVG
jgi:hypothetical protein